MESLDALVTQAQGLSGRRDDLAHLLSLLQSKGGEMLARCSSADLEQVLLVLDAHAHSLACLWVLDALTQQLARGIPHPGASLAGAAAAPTAPALSPAAAASAERIVTAVSSFLGQCSPAQVRMDPPKFAGLCRRLKDTLVALGASTHAARGILPLRSALGTLAPSPSHLTPIHADLLQLCLLARQHPLGLQLLCHSTVPARGGARVGPGEEEERLIVDVDPHETGVTLTDFLLFCYYGGMVCLGMRRLDQASRMFLHALTAPAVGLSAITVACYKKLVLVSLILHGKPPALPRFTPSVVMRQLKPHSAEYSELAEAYSTGDPESLQSLLDKHRDSLLRDGNWGLAQQVRVWLFRRSIQRLTQTYLTLSLADIARTVHLRGPDEAEDYILSMILDGDIHARISQKDGMVSFQEDPQGYNTHAMGRHLNSQISRVIELGQRVEDMESSIACDRLYLTRVHMREKTGRFVDPDEIEFGGPSRMFDTM